MLIAITGAKGAGKDTISLMISQYLELTTISLSDPLKKCLIELFGFTPHQVYQDKESLSNWGITPRQALQFFGTEVMQYKIQELLPIGRNFWVKRLMENLSPDKFYLLTDLRFIFEAEYLQPDIIIKIIRPGLTEDNHSSEQEWKFIKEDYLINNDSDLDHLNRIISALIPKLQEKLNQSSK